MLLSWNQSSDQVDLEEMAQNYIDDGNGDRFWSPSRRWNHDSEIQFPKDRARIVELLKQLFWKQNRYSFNNSQYGHKGSETRGQSREETTPVRQIDPAMPLGASPTTKTAVASSGSLPAKSKSPRNPIQFATLDETRHKHEPPPAGGIDSPFFDIFEVPDDSDHHEETTFSHFPKRRQSISNIGESPRKKKKYHLEEPLRRTDRKRVIRNFPHTVPDDQIEKLINDEIEVHDLTHNTQPAGASVTMGSSKSPMPQDRMMDAEGNSNNPLPRVSPVARRPAPTATMVASNIRKSSSPQSKASKRGLTTNHSDPYKSSTLSFSRNDSTSVTSKSKTSKTIPQPRIDPALELDKSNSRTSGASPSVLSSQKEGNSTRMMSGVSNIDTMDESSEIEDPQPSVAASNGPLTVVTDKSGIHRLSAHEVGIRKPSPTEQFDLASELSPVSSSSQSVDVDNPAGPPNRSQTLSKISDTFKYLPDMPEKAAENHSRLETPLQRAETVDNETKISTTAPISPQTPTKTQPTPHSPPRAALPKTRQKTQIPLWIVTREPRYTEERWDDGKFMGTPLPAFIEGISKFTQRCHIEKIKLTLRAPTFDTKITVFKDAEDSWASAKETFIEKLKEAKLEARARRQMENVTFKILVEPFYEEGTFPSGSIDEFEEEFDF
ncbi:hypothetical protein LSUB1_G003338 [Lachnellula subtilissima]|uniref:Uncharacterized protein n=1 Tax=Lachnellula subtilissima TaxID=602034 RepID=A0A8H8S0Z0_9HELO|nr:hypothetical protein LSUB1_G003338 [Lachnellula subtilissima]